MNLVLTTSHSKFTAYKTFLALATYVKTEVHIIFILPCYYYVSLLDSLVLSLVIRLKIMKALNHLHSAPVKCLETRPGNILVNRQDQANFLDRDRVRDQVLEMTSHR